MAEPTMPAPGVVDGCQAFSRINFTKASPRMTTRGWFEGLATSSDGEAARGTTVTVLPLLDRRMVAWSPILGGMQRLVLGKRCAAPAGTTVAPKRRLEMGARGLDCAGVRWRVPPDASMLPCIDLLMLSKRADRRLRSRAGLDQNRRLKERVRSDLHFNLHRGCSSAILALLGC